MEGEEANSLYSTDWASPEEASSALLRLCGSVPPCQGGRSDPAPLRAYSDLQALRAWSGANASSGGLGSRISDQSEGSEAADDKSSQSEDPNDFFVQQSRRELQWRREQRCRTAQVPCAPSLAFHITLEELLSVTSSFCRDAALLAYASDMTHNVNSSPPHDAAALDQPEFDSQAGSQALARKHLKEAIDSAHAMGHKQFLCSVWNAERSDDSHIVYRSPWSGRYMSPIASMPDTLDEAIIQSWEHEAQRIDAAAAQMRWAVACAAEERSLEAALERHLNRLLPRYMTAYTPATPSSPKECHCPMTTVPHTTATAFVRRVTVPSRQPAATPLPSVEVIVLTRRSAHNCVCNGCESGGVEPPLLVSGHAFEVRLSSEAVVVASHESSCVMSGHDARIKLGAPPSYFWYHCKKYKQDTAAVAGPSSSPQSCHAAVFGETTTSSCWVNADELAADLMQRVERAEGIAHREMNSRSRVALTALLHRS